MLKQTVLVLISRASEAARGESERHPPPCSLLLYLTLSHSLSLSLSLSKKPRPLNQHQLPKKFSSLTQQQIFTIDTGGGGEIKTKIIPHFNFFLNLWSQRHSRQQRRALAAALLQLKGRWLMYDVTDASFSPRPSVEMIDSLKEF